MEATLHYSIDVNKNTCFYYWVQAVSGWDPVTSKSENYNYYIDQLKGLDTKQEQNLKSIQNILEKSNNPRQLLAELYLEDIVSNEAKEIAELARSLANYFEETWDDSKDNLLEWQQELTKIDFQAHTEELSKIVHFLDSNFDLNSELKVFIIQNPPNRLSSGHMIKRSDFILLHPPTRPYAKNIEHIATALLHEYIHAIEFSSNSTRELFKNSFNKHILHSGVVKPAGITWNMFYAEIIVYCFANNITGGYLKPEIYKEPRPSVEEMQDSFWRLVKSGKHNDNHIISWIALNILNDVESYIQEGKVIDETSADKISLLILEFYSKHQHLK